MRRFVLLFLLAALLMPLASPFGPTASAAPLAQPGGNWAIPGGRFFTETAPAGYGFSVIDDGQARFWTEFNRLGGLDNVGYPISRRFVYDGFVTQAFQKLVLQWRPEVNQAWPVNVFDELSRRGFDSVLFVQRQTPFPLQNFDPPGATWAQIVRNRQALLDARPALRARYFSVADPLTVFGLPVSRVEDMGNHYAVRTQRAVFQQWKENVPWARAGQVTIANGGDIAKELGWLSAAAATPEPIPGQSPSPGLKIESIAIGAGASPRLYALLMESRVLPNPAVEIRTSDDLGQSWRPFNGGVPACILSLTVDGRTDTLYALACDGFHRWTGSVWVPVGGTEATHDVAFHPTAPLRLWLANGLVGLHRSDDGGVTRTPLADAGFAFRVEVDPINPDLLYTVSWNRHTPPFLRRGNGNGTNWADLPRPGGHYVAEGLVSDPQNGDLYVTTVNQSPNSLWRSRNPRATTAAEVRWEKLSEFPAGRGAHLLAAARIGGQLVLFARLTAGDDPLATVGTYRSTDGGATWTELSPNR